MSILSNDEVTEIICDSSDEELKKCIKDLLIKICYGKKALDLEIITFEETIEELNKRIIKKTESQKAGMIGELLFHLKSFECFNGYEHISVYLNKEERSVKKGFDVLLFDGSKVWYSEVKSRENASESDISAAHSDKIKEAILDLKDKFKSDNKNYWLTAKTNIVNVEDEILEKQIASILTNDINYDIEKNSIGVSVVFKSDIKNINKEKIKNVLDIYKSDFNSLIAVCISYEDYNKIINILKEIENETE